MDKAKKKRLKQYLAWVLLAALVVGLSVMPLLARNEAKEDGPVASILQAAVQTGSIETSLKGGGTLTAADTMDITLPTGVKITEFLVENGDYVTEGTPVAAVDKVTLMNAIVEVQDTLDYLWDEIKDASDDTISSTITAPAGGYVKKVFAKAGDDVRDVMLRHGALAVLSLDGRMAVKLTGHLQLAAGDAVWVTLSDGREISGRVESNLDGQIVISVEDKGYEIGEAVAVTTEEGDSLGSSELYVHNVWTATGFSGTIRQVYAKETATVSDNATLFALTDTDFIAARDSYADLHREYEELLQEMFRMYETGVVTAPCNGKISGVDEDSAFLLSALQGQQGWFVDLLDNPAPEGVEKGWTVMLLSSEPECTKSLMEGDCLAKTHEEGCYYYCTGQEGCTAVDHNPGCAVLYCTMAPDCANINHLTGCKGVCTGDSSCASTRDHHFHLTSCIKRCTTDMEEDPATVCDADIHRAACIENCSEAEQCSALIHKSGCSLYGVIYEAYASIVTVSAEGELQVLKDPTPYTVTPGKEDAWTLVAPDKLLNLFIEPDAVAVTNHQDFQKNDIILQITGKDTDDNVVYENVVVYQKAQQDGQQGGSGGLGNLGGLGGFGGMGGFGGLFGFGGLTGQGPTDAGNNLFDLDGEVLMTVTGQETMTLTITIDETNIAKVFPGQLALVDITAIRNKTFEAEVTEIGTTGTNSGGSSKFTVELTLPLHEDMLAGMNATAILPLYTKQDVLMIPVAALVETDTGTVVCTAIDPDTGNPGSPAAVTTGISDGINVEILSGLELGDTVYYSYYDTLELDNVAKTELDFSFG